jgi:hypothetical protein
MTQHSSGSPEQPQLPSQKLPSIETFYGYLAAHADPHQTPYSQVIEWMTRGASTSELDNLLEGQWMGFPPDSPQAQEYHQVYTVLDAYRKQCTIPDQCVTRRLLPCPSQSVCQGKTTEHFTIGDYYECQECGCRQHFQKLGPVAFRATDQEEWWESW